MVVPSILKNGKSKLKLIIYLLPSFSVALSPSLSSLLGSHQTAQTFIFHMWLRINKLICDSIVLFALHHRVSLWAHSGFIKVGSSE